MLENAVSASVHNMVSYTIYLQTLTLARPTRRFDTLFR